MIRIATTARIARYGSSLSEMSGTESEAWPIGNDKTLQRVAAITPIAEASEEYLYVVARAISGLEKWGPNDNGDAFEWQELLAAYPTFVRGGVYCDHDNEDKNKAVGIIIDAQPDHDQETVDVLMAISRTRAPKTCKGIEDGTITDVSMGVIVGEAICSVCHNVATTEEEYCDHVRHHKAQEISIVPADRNKGTQIVKVFEINRDLCFFEVSVIGADSEGADPEAKFKYKIGSRNSASFSDYIIQHERIVEWSPAEDGEGFVAKWSMPVSGSERTSSFRTRSELDQFLKQMESAGFKSKEDKGMANGTETRTQREAASQPLPDDRNTFLDRGDYGDPAEYFQKDYDRAKQDTPDTEDRGSQVTTQVDRGQYKQAKSGLEEALATVATAAIEEEQRAEIESKAKGIKDAIKGALGFGHKKTARDIPLGSDDGDVTKGAYGGDTPLRGNPMWMQWYGPYGDTTFLFAEQWDESKAKADESRSDIDKERAMGGFAGPVSTQQEMQQYLKSSTANLQIPPEILRRAQEDVDKAETEAKAIGITDTDWNQADVMDKLEMTARVFVRSNPTMPLPTVVALLTDIRSLSDEQSRGLLDRLTAMPTTATKKAKRKTRVVKKAQDSLDPIEQDMTVEELQQAYSQATTDDERAGLRDLYRKKKQMEARRTLAAAQHKELLSYVKRRKKEGADFSTIREEVTAKFPQGMSSSTDTPQPAAKRGPTEDGFGGPGMSHEVPGTGDASEFGPYPRRNSAKDMTDKEKAEKEKAEKEGKMVVKKAVLYHCPICNVAYPPVKIAEYRDGTTALCPVHGSATNPVIVENEEVVAAGDTGPGTGPGYMGSDATPPKPPKGKEDDEEKDDEEDDEEKDKSKSKSPGRPPGTKNKPKAPTGPPSSPGEGYAGVSPAEMNEREFPRSSAMRRKTAADVGQFDVDITRGTGTLWNPETISISDQENKSQDSEFKAELKEARKAELQFRNASGDFEDYLVSMGRKEDLSKLKAEGKTERQKEIDALYKETKGSAAIKKKLADLPANVRDRWCKTYANALYDAWKVKGKAKGEAKKSAEEAAWTKLPKKYKEDNKKKAIRTAAEGTGSDILAPNKPSGSKGTTSSDLAAAEDAEQAKEFANDLKEAVGQATIKVEKNGWVALGNGTNSWAVYTPQQEKAVVVALADVDPEVMAKEYNLPADEDVVEMFNSEQYGQDIITDSIEAKKQLEAASGTPVVGAVIKIADDWLPTGDETAELLTDLTTWKDEGLEGVIHEVDQDEQEVLASFGEGSLYLGFDEIKVVGQNETGTDVNWTEETQEVADKATSEEEKEFKTEMGRNSFGPDTKMASKQASDDPEALRARVAKLQREKCVRIAEEMAQKEMLPGLGEAVTPEEVAALVQDKADELLTLDDKGLYEIESAVKSALDPQGQSAPSNKTALRNPVISRGMSNSKNSAEWDLENPNFFG